MEVSIRPSDTDKTEDYWMERRNIDENMRTWWQQSGRKDFDFYFDMKGALEDYKQYYKERLQAADQVGKR